MHFVGVGPNLNSFVMNQPEAYARLFSAYR
jgi:hypothetical protein